MSPCYSSPRIPESQRVAIDLIDIVIASTDITSGAKHGIRCALYNASAVAKVVQKLVPALMGKCKWAAINEIFDGLHTHSRASVCDILNEMLTRAQGVGCDSELKEYINKVAEGIAETQPGLADMLRGVHDEVSRIL